MSKKMIHNDNIKLDKTIGDCCNNTFCQSLETSTKASLCKIALRVSYKARKVFEIEIGQEGKLMLLDKGLVIPSRFRKDGKQIGIECLDEGEILGLSQLFSDAKHCISVYVKKDLEGCIFPAVQFQQLCISNFNLAAKVMRNLSNRFAKNINQLECMTLGNGEERILYLGKYLGNHRNLVSQSPKTIDCTHDELALLAGMNRVTVSRAIDHLKQKGVLTTSRGKLRFL